MSRERIINQLTSNQLLLANLNQLIDEKKEVLTKVTEKIKVIQKFLQKIVKYLESSEVWYLSDINETKDVIQTAKDLIDTCAKKVLTNNTATIYWIEEWRMSIQLRRLIDKIRRLWDAVLHVSRHSYTDISMAPAMDRTLDMTRRVQLLPTHLKQCLYYFVLFPAYFKVPARRLIVLWVADSLAHMKINKNLSVEHVAENYLDRLIVEGMVHVTKKLNGKPKACQLENGMREYLLRAAEEQRFLQTSNGSISRLVDHHHGATDSCFIKIHGDPNFSVSSPNVYREVLSFLSFDTQDGSKPGQDIGDFIGKCISAGGFQSLTTLDLERVFRPKLPKELQKLTRLWYLGLRWTYLEKLPKFMSSLLNLKVLDVKHTYISILPKSIWRMQYLRHLYLSETYRIKFDGRPSKISLNNLQTLWGAFIDENTLVKEGLDTARNIRKLGLACRSSSSESSSLMSSQLDAVAEWISNLKSLESLRLKSRDEKGKASNLRLQSLENNKNLSTVYLLGKLAQPVVQNFPANLIEITLSGSELTDDPMERMKLLPGLLILRLLSQSVVNSDMKCSIGGFAKLKILYVWKLEKLKKWVVELGALPSLEYLEIRSCGMLENLPYVTTVKTKLKKYYLTSMPEKFVDKIKREQNELWNELGNVLEIRSERMMKSAAFGAKKVTPPNAIELPFASVMFEQPLAETVGGRIGTSEAATPDPAIMTVASSQQVGEPSSRRAGKEPYVAPKKTGKDLGRITSRSGPLKICEPESGAAAEKTEVEVSNSCKKMRSDDVLVPVGRYHSPDSSLLDREEVKKILDTEKESLSSPSTELEEELREKSRELIKAEGIQERRCLFTQPAEELSYTAVFVNQFVDGLLKSMTSVTNTQQFTHHFFATAKDYCKQQVPNMELVDGSRCICFSEWASKFRPRRQHLTEQSWSPRSLIQELQQKKQSLR